MYIPEKVIEVEPAQRPKGLTVWAPISGQLYPLDKYPNPLYQQRIMGEGIAIELTGTKVHAPFNGVVTELTPCCHRIQLQSDKGLKLLITLGSGTEQLMGQGLTRLVKEKQKVKAGQALVQFDLRTLQQHCTSLLCPVLITNNEKIGSICIENSAVTAGEDIMFIVRVMKKTTKE